MPVSSRSLVHPPTVDAPDGLRPYLFHGVDLTVHSGQGIGSCPFCGKDGKFEVEESTTRFHCWVCDVRGNALEFLRQLHALAAGSFSPPTMPHNQSGNGVAHSPYPAGDRPAQANVGGFHAAVAGDRRLADAGTPAAWGVYPSPLDGAWLVPGYAADGRLDQLYRRVWMDGSWKLLPTPGVWTEGKAHALHLASGDFNPTYPAVVVCEGPWDGMALWEVWDRTTCANNIIAVPGCNVWRDEWSELCRGKHVTLMYDNDHPRVHGGKTFRAGFDAMYRVARRLSGIAASVRWLRWGKEGWDESKPSGWDVRDHLSSATDRRTALVELLAKVQDAPADWFSPTSGAVGSGKPHVAAVEPQACHAWSDCEAAWRVAMQWREDMGDALAVLLAVCASTQQAGNQLFLQCVGSAGSGKTTMCEGLLVSRHCHHLEHLTGFHSGWKGEDDKDCSLIARINGKTLITPEADVLMTSPKFHEIMGQQRRIFDGKSAATYKNTDKDTLWSGLRTPWIMAGTPSMMDHDQSHLGDRFLRYIIGDPSEDEKRLILRSALKSERVAMLETSNGTAGSIVDPKTRRAHALTGGYVDWLRAHVEQQLAQIDVSEEAEDRCIDMAELSADLRARPNRDVKKHDTHDTKELPTRLARQNIRLASCLAVVLNKSEVDGDVLRIVRKVALDTAYGHSLNIVKWLTSPNPKADHLPFQECGGLMEGILAQWTSMTPDRLQSYLNFLRKIGVVDLKRVPQFSNAWVLTDRVYDLYLRIMGD